MSDELDDRSYSPFWPLAILLAGLLLWSAYQVYEGYTQKNALDAELAHGASAINEARIAKPKLYAVAQDLAQMSSRDANAAEIMKEAKIQVRQTKPNAGAGTTTPDNDKLAP